MNHAKTTDRLAFTTNEVAQFLGMTPTALRSMIIRGRVRVVHIGRKTLIPKTAVERLLDTSK
jgi:excisionase family DNA binding protein